MKINPLKFKKIILLANSWEHRKSNSSYWMTAVFFKVLETIYCFDLRGQYIHYNVTYYHVFPVSVQTLDL